MKREYCVTASFTIYWDYYNCSVMACFRECVFIQRKYLLDMVQKNANKLEPVGIRNTLLNVIRLFRF